MKHRNLILGIILVLLIILCGIGVGYNIYNQKVKTNNLSNNESKLENENIGKFDKKLDINAIDMDTKLAGGKFIPEPLTKLKENSNEISLFYDEDGDYPNVKYKYNNGTFYVIDGDGFKKEYSNIKNIYYEIFECSSERNFYILQENKVIFLSYFPGSTLEELEEEIINTTRVYDDIYSVYVSSSTCDAIYDYVGYINDTGKFYNLETNEEIDTEQEYSIYGSVTTDRNLKIDNYNLKVKLIITDSEIDGILDYVVDEDNYLYGYIWSEDDVIFKKLSNKKVKYIYYSNDERCTYVQFEDNSLHDFGEEDYLSYSSLKY